jgi:hypothetical protein
MRDVRRCSTHGRRRRAPMCDATGAAEGAHPPAPSRPHGAAARAARNARIAAMRANDFAGQLGR